MRFSLFPRMFFFLCFFVFTVTASAKPLVEVSPFNLIIELTDDCTENTMNWYSVLLTDGSVVDSNELKKRQLDVITKPVFLGCTEETDENKRRICSQSKLLEFIYSKVNYTEQALRDKIEGRAVVKFNIDIAGNVEDIVILKDPGGGLGEEVRRVVTMTENLWTPGTKNGESSIAEIVVPIKFIWKESRMTNAAGIEKMAETYKSGDFKKTIKLAKAMIKNSPEEGAAYHYRALSYYNLGKKEKVCDDLSKAKLLGFKESATMHSALCGE